MSADLWMWSDLALTFAVLRACVALSPLAAHVCPCSLAAPPVSSQDAHFLEGKVHCSPFSGSTGIAFESISFYVLIRQATPFFIFVKMTVIL